MRLRHHIRRAAIACVAMLPLIAGEYHGLVKFGSLPLPGATLTATQGDKKVTAVSDQQGAFSFADLPDGAWQVEVEKPGFSTAKQDVNAGNGLPGPTFELKMLPMDEIQAVAPTAAPATVVGPSSTITSSSPNATPAAAGTTAGSNGAASSSAPGPATAQGKPGKGGAPVAKTATAFQRTDLNGAKNAPAPAAAAEPAPEVTTELNQRAADGFLINGSAVNGASTPFAQSQAFGNSRKGARSLYSGAIQLVLDTSHLDARQYSLTGQETEKPDTNHFTGGFSFGGPIKIPHLIPRNGPTFNVQYQWVRNRNATVQSTLMPDAAERGGDFSQEMNNAGKPVQIYDPQTGDPFPGNIVPVSRISPQAQALLQFYPAPNFPTGGGYNYQVPITNNQHQDSLQSRVNKSFKRKNFIAGGFAFQDTRSDNNNLFNFLDNSRSLGMNANVSYRRTYTARFFGTFGYTFSRQSNTTIPFFADRTNVSGIAGITGNNQDPVNWGPPSLAFSSGIATLSDAQSSVVHNQTSAISYDSSWSHNRHALTFGGDFRQQQFNTISQQNPRGGFAFNGTSTQQTLLGAPVEGTGSDFAGFLLGIPDTSALAFGNADKYFRSTQSDLYLTDDWRVSPGLTLNIGARWEYSAPITEKYGRLVNLDIAPGFTAVAPVVGNNPTGSLTGTKYPDSLVAPDKHAIQPRVAFSWRPFPASSMVVRGGYGIYYNTSSYLTFANYMAQQSPLSTSLSVQNSLINPLTLADGFNVAPNITTNTFAIDPNFRVGYSQNWQVSVQRDLPAALMMTATYSGVKGTRAAQAFLPNTYPAGVLKPCPTCISGYTYLASNGNSTREAGAIQLRRRLHNGFTATVNYTYSKSIDDAAGLGGRVGTSVVAQDWLHLNAERGLSSFDQRHLANIQLQYTTGMGVGGGTLLSGWRGRVIKDWTFTDAITLGSGLPLTPTYLSAVRGTGSTGSIRPDYTGLPVYDAPPGAFLNPLAYAAPAAGQWGNAGRYSIIGPSQFTMVGSMSRAFRLSDRFTANLRIDATNPLNHVTYPSWNTTVNSPQFGLANPANPMRSVQTTLRVTF